MKNYLQKNWLLIFIMIQPLLDVVAYFQYNNVVGSIAGYLRLFLMIAIAIYALIKTDKKKSFCILFAIMAVFSIAHIANGFRVGYVSIFQDVMYLLRVLQMPVLAISFIYLFKQETYKEQVNKGFIINLIAISIIILISHLTNTAAFTYPDYYTGLLGWFGNANSQSIILISLVPLALAYGLQLKNKFYIVGIMLLSWFLLISNGTKAAYYSIFIIFGILIVCFLLLALIKKEKITKWILGYISFSILIGIVSYVVYPLTPRYQVDNYSASVTNVEQEQLDKDLGSIEKNGEKLTLEEVLNDKKLYNEVMKQYTPFLSKEMIQRFGIDAIMAEYGYLPAVYTLKDMRMKKVVYARLLWKETDTITSFVGFEFTKIDGFDLENDYPAIYYYYGYVGVALYAMLIAYALFRLLQALLLNFKDSLTIYNVMLALTLLLQLGLAEFSGAILRRPNASVYLSIVIGVVVYQSSVIRKKRDKK